MATDQKIILYDGMCGLCDRIVGMVLRKDKHDRFRFAALQTQLAQSILARHHLQQSPLDTVYLVENHGQPTETLLAKSDALIAILQGLGGFWIGEAAILRLAPKWARDRMYEAVSRNRYRLFGRYETCIVPNPTYREKFLE